MVFSIIVFVLNIILLLLLCRGCYMLGYTKGNLEGHEEGLTITFSIIAKQENEEIQDQEDDGSAL